MFDAIEKLITECHQRRDRWIHESLERSEGCCAACCGAVFGHLEKSLSRVEETVDKLEAKSDRFIQRAISNAYQNFVNTGGWVPTEGELFADQDAGQDVRKILAKLQANRAGNPLPEPEQPALPAPFVQGRLEAGQPVPPAPKPAGERQQAAGPAFPAGIGPADLGGMIEDALKNQLALNGKLPAPQRDALAGLAEALRRPGGQAALGGLVGDVLRGGAAGGLNPGLVGLPARPAVLDQPLRPQQPPPVPVFPPRDKAAADQAKDEQKKKDEDKQKFDQQKLQAGAVADWCRVRNWKGVERATTGLGGTRATDIITNAIKRLNVAGVSIGDVMESLVNVVTGFDPKVAGCGDDAKTKVARFAGLVNFFYSWLGIEQPGVRTSLRQTLAAMCPQGVPTPDQAQQLWLQGNGQRTLAETWWAANDLCPDLQAQIAELNRTRPGVAEAVQLYLRDEITRPELTEKLRGLGVTELTDHALFLALANFIPPASDLVSFMVKDVFDEAVVAKYGYDEDFQLKFQGKARDWARAQGMTDEQFRFYWRAHWRLISPGQGYEMLHRLRPGAVDANVVTTRQDIEELLNIDDYPEFWRKRLIAISYKPLTRVDTQRAYFVGAITEKEVNDNFKDLGYDDRNADRMTAFTKKLRQRWVLRQVGAPTPAQLAQQHADGLLSRPELVIAIQDYGFEQADLQLFSKVIDQKQQVAKRRTALRSVRQRYLQGMIPDNQVVIDLTARDIDQANAQRLAADWKDERDLISRQIAAGPLCDMASRKLISNDEYRMALLRLGYKAREAQRLVDLCAEKQHDREERQQRKLTPAQLCKAYEDGQITQQVYGEKLVKLGFDQADAQTVIDLCDKAAKDRKNKARKFSVAQICQAQIDGLLTPTRAVEELRQLGFDDEHALILATECKDAKKEQAKDKGAKKLSNAQLCRAWKTGLISSAVFFHAMQDLGYDVEDARILGNLCGFDLTKEQQADLQKAVKAFQQAADKAAKDKKAAVAELRQADKDAQAAQDKRLKALEKARKDAQAAIDKAKKEAGQDTPE